MLDEEHFAERASAEHFLHFKVLQFHLLPLLVLLVNGLRRHLEHAAVFRVLKAFCFHFLAVVFLGFRKAFDTHGDVVLELGQELLLHFGAVLRALRRRLFKVAIESP